MNHTDGITLGCEVSISGESVNIQPGYFVTAGRWTKITGVETVPSPEIISGQIYCVVVYEIDLSQTNTPSEFNQGHFKTLTSTTAYPDITKEDLENGGTIYQFPFCQYVKNTSGISQFVDARAIFNIEEVWKAIAEQNLNYKEEFEAFFAEQKKEIDEIKEGLNETGNATVDSTGLVKPDGKTINVDDHGTISVDVLDSMEEVNANTDPGKPAGALAVKELSRDLQSYTVVDLDVVLLNGNSGFARLYKYNKMRILYWESCQYASLQNAVSALSSENLPSNRFIGMGSRMNSGGLEWQQGRVSIENSDGRVSFSQSAENDTTRECNSTDWVYGSISWFAE